MSFDIPLTIEPQVIEYAQSEHITQDEAIVRLIQAGLTASHRADPHGHPTAATIVDKTRPSSGPGVARRGPRAPLLMDDPESIIGLFADTPRFRESIESVIARRSQRYGTES